MTHFPGRVLPKQSRKVESKRPTREQIEDQVAKFLQQGGVIQQLHPERAQNNGLAEINKKCDHDSTIFYKEVIKLYINEFGDLPSKVGPGKEVTLVSDKY